MPPSLRNQEAPVTAYVSLARGETLHMAWRVVSPAVKGVRTGRGTSLSQRECSTLRVMRAVVAAASRALMRPTATAGVRDHELGLPTLTRDEMW
jgi:hypothetical protein